jgi:glycosyltransferase involved in cell wall biosynthesis
MEATCPYGFETLHQFSDESVDQQMASFMAKLKITRQVAQVGDFFFSANERQRDYWLGVLDAVGRVNPATYACDATLNRLIDVVPFGLPSRRPEYHGPVIKGVIPGIDPTDRVVLWGGGLWQWFDPLSLVRAVVRLAQTRDDVRLLFPGTRHPNPIIQDMPVLQETRELCDRLGLTGKVAFFGDWVPYHLWASYLMEADVGASMHFDTLETRFSFRTRILDYIWAELPMVVTGGDAASELVTRFNLGEVVPPGDDQSITEALDSLLKHPSLRETLRPRFEEVRPHLTWEKVCEPIARFCARPRFASDRAAVHGLPQEMAEAVPPVEAQLKQQRNELARLRALVRNYEQGRFIRLTRWLANCKSRWRRKWSP